MVKLPWAVVLQPVGGGEEGATPSGGPWASATAAREKALRMLDARMMRIVDVLLLGLSKGEGERYCYGKQGVEGQEKRVC